MPERFRPIATNLTPVNVVGIPGLMLVLIAIALAFQFPEARWLIAAGVLGGVAIAALLIQRRRRHSDDGDDPWHGVLGVNHDDKDRLGSVESNRARAPRDRRRRTLRHRLDQIPALTC